MKHGVASATEITQLLAYARDGGKEPIERLFALQYFELRHLAASRLGSGDHTLTPTVPVHEAF